MRIYSRVILVGLSGILSLTLAACIKTDHLYLAKDRFPPYPSTFQVEFLTELPSRPYIKLAMVEAREHSGNSTWEELREALGQKAAEIGADAIVELSMGGSPVGFVGGSGSGFAGGMREKKKLTGVAIRYK